MSYFSDKQGVTATWENSNKDCVQIHYLNDLQESVYEIVGVVAPEFSELVELVGGMDNIDSATVEKEIKDIELFANIVQYINNKPSAETVTEKIEVEKPLNLTRFTDEFTQEELFKLKLEIFEMSEISETAPREVKSKLRKSKSIFELFAVLYNYQNSVVDSK